MAGRAARLYAALAVVGAVLPYAIILAWSAKAEFLPARFAGGLLASGPAAVFSTDALFSALVFLTWSRIEMRAAGRRGWWVYPVVTLMVGLCCALPLFLWRRQVHREARAARDGR